MYLAILILPLLGSFLATNRKVGVKLGPIISVGSMGLAVFCCIGIFYEVGLNGSPVYLSLGNWIDFGNLLIQWSFLFDTLTVSMYLPIIIISFLVQMYSQEYMNHDPHRGRFFSLLSLFSFTMLILVTGDNLFMILLGWEGELDCLKSFIQPYKGLRIGPHNLDVISTQFGSILGDGHLEKRNILGGTRFKITQSHANVEYLKSFHNFFVERGYCNPKKPHLIKRPVGGFKPGFEYNFSSYTFTSLNWLHEIFYQNGRKIMPTYKSLELYFTPLAFAHLFKGNGSRAKNAGAKIALNKDFTKEEVILFSEALRDHYDLKTSVHAHTMGTKVPIIYIYKESLPIQSNHIKKYMLPSKYYKLN